MKRIVSEAAWNAELEAKHQKLVEWMHAQKLAGVLIRRNENVAWVTGGAVEVRVLTPGETGVASLLVTAEGKRYYFTRKTKRRACTMRNLARWISSRCFFRGMRTIRLKQRSALPAGPLG